MQTIHGQHIEPPGKPFTEKTLKMWNKWYIIIGAIFAALLIFFKSFEAFSEGEIYYGVTLVAGAFGWVLVCIQNVIPETAQAAISTQPR